MLFNPKQPGFYNPNMLGPGLLDNYAVSVYDAYDRMKFRADADLATKSITFFRTALGQSYVPLNDAAVNLTKDVADTNWDLTGQTQYGYVFEGISFSLGTLAGKTGTVGGADGVDNWPNTANLIAQESAYELFVNDTSMDRGKLLHAPAAGGLSGFAAVGVLAAGTAATMVVTGNGTAHASNYKSYAQAPLWVPVNQRVKVTLTFGQAALAASMTYKPAVSSIFIECRLIGRRVAMVGA